MRVLFKYWISLSNIMQVIYLFFKKPRFMKMYILLCLFIFSLGKLTAQKLERQVVASAGDHLQSGSLTLDWTLGETMVETYESSNNLSLNQGFRVGSIIMVGTFEPSNDLKFEAFPNPTSEIVYVSSNSNKRLSVAIVDLMGRTLSIQDIEFPVVKAPIYLSGLPAATYFLRISDKSGNANYILTILKM